MAVDTGLIGEIGIVPVVKIEDAGAALSLGRALVAGDLPIAEVTFRTEFAEEAIRILSREIPEMLVGAGTVLTEEQAARAVKAGARFVVSPGFNPRVVDFCLGRGVPVFPGINSPAGIEMALERGLEIVKFFPAEASGGLALLKAMSGPYGAIRFIPTGGVNAANLMSYLSNDRVYACGGSWMVRADLIAAGKFEEITRLAKEATEIVLGFEFAHLGINETSEKHALSAAAKLEDLFSFTSKPGGSSVFAGPAVEILKAPYLGEKGHIAVATNDIDRGIAYMRRKGISIRSDTAKEREGKIVAVYTDQEIGGFAIHLVKKH
jgi:2-dehydro-3-deoxyphosphogluconate aldolase/(4S)-4-hydroxy-2-oxoglutarate aldolase